MTRPASFALSDISAYETVNTDVVHEGRTPDNERLSLGELLSLEEEVSNEGRAHIEPPRASVEHSALNSRSTSITDRTLMRIYSSSHKRTINSGSSLINDKTPSAANWPTAPKRLGHIQYHLFTGDALLFLLPVLFLTLAVAAYKIDGKPLSGYGEAVQQASRLGPSVYPLLFAAVGGRCLKSVAVRWAERGTSIESLEKLLGSRSVVSAVGTTISLGSINTLSVVLLVIWALSPLGGQSSLRLLQTTNSTVSERGTIFYADHQAPFSFQETASWASVVPGVLSASLIASDVLGSGSTDLWKHPRIARLAELEKPDANDTWINIMQQSDLKYSSWTGINIQNLRADRRSNFSIKHSYMYLDCTRMLRMNSEQELKTLNMTFYPAFENNPDFLTGKTAPTEYSFCDRARVRGDVNFLKRAYYGGNPVTDQQLYNTSVRPTYENTSIQYPMSLFYGTIVDAKPCANIFECKVKIATVDAQVVCAEDDCNVERLRRGSDQLYRTAGNKRCNNVNNTIDCLRSSTAILDSFITMFSNVTAGSFSTSTGAKFRSPGNPFDDYIFDRKSSFGRSPEGGTGRFSGTPELVAQRLTTLLNTYWQAGSWGTQLIKAEPFVKPKHLDEMTTGPIEVEKLNNETDATFSRQVPVYVASMPWIVVLVLTTTVLLALGAINIVILYTTAAPDIFEYASLLTRENPYIALPPGGTGLAGAKRSKLLRRLRVQLVDVKPEGDVGYVALKNVQKREGYHEGRLRFGRLYE